jgi:hypothetical protein
MVASCVDDGRRRTIRSNGDLDAVPYLSTQSLDRQAKAINRLRMVQLTSILGLRSIGCVVYVKSQSHCILWLYYERKARLSQTP